MSVTLIFAADRHEKYSRFDDFTDVSESSIPGLLAQVKDSGVVDPDAVLIAGDYVGRFGGGGNFPFSFDDLDAEIASAYGPGKVPAYYTYGSHDKMHYISLSNGADGEPIFEFSYDGFLSGPVRRNGYYLYGISFTQMNYDTDEHALADIEKKKLNGRELELDLTDPRGVSAESASKCFLSWIDGLDDHDPIVMASHMPLHYNEVRKDNQGGLIWMDALNRASEKHDIFIIWGHNHTVEERFDRGESHMSSIADREYYLALPGSCVPFPTGKKEYLFDEDGNPVLDRRGNQEFNVSHEDFKIYFTYMNAGYLKLGYCHTITFSDDDNDGMFDSADIRRYSLHLDPKNDITDFGTSGYTSPLRIELRKFK